jgi:hypothetical protein
MAYSKETITDLLDALLVGTMAEAARRVGISPSLPWKWLVRSRLGDPAFQEITFCGVVAAFHVHYTQNVPTLMAKQIEQTALERARDGVYTDVFFQGQRQYERVLKPEFAGKSDDDLMFEVGADFKTICYETRPTRQWLKPSDALVTKVLESWQRKRYGAHQEVSVTYGGVLRLERPEEQAKVIDQTPEVFEQDAEAAQEGGHHLALARPAKDSAEMDKWSAAGEFAPAPVTFVDAKGARTELRADLEQRLQTLKERGPEHKQPSHHVAVGKPDDEPKTEPQPTPQTLADHPRAYYVEKLQPARKPPSCSRDEHNVGTGREGLGVGPDPSMIGGSRGFRMTKV